MLPRIELMEGQGSESLPTTGVGLSLREVRRKIRARNPRGDDEVTLNRSGWRDLQENLLSV